MGSRVKTWIQRSTGRRVNGISIRIDHDLYLSELVDGLCSKYRDSSWEELPECLTGAKILEIVKDEYTYHGTANVWSWVESGAFDNTVDRRDWATNLIIDAFPELDENRG